MAANGLVDAQPWPGSATSASRAAAAAAVTNEKLLFFKDLVAGTIVALPRM